MPSRHKCIKHISTEAPNEGGLGTNKDKTNVTYDTTDAQRRAATEEPCGMVSGKTTRGLQPVLDFRGNTLIICRALYILFPFNVFFF